MSLQMFIEIFHMQALWFYFKDLPYFWPQLYLLLSFLMRFNFLAKVFYNLLIKILESYSTFTSEIKLDNISLLREFAHAMADHFDGTTPTSDAEERCLLTRIMWAP